MPARRHAGVRAGGHAGMLGCGDTGTRACGDAGVPGCWHAGIRAGGHAGILASRDAGAKNKNARFAPGVAKRGALFTLARAGSFDRRLLESVKKDAPCVLTHPGMPVCAPGSFSSPKKRRRMPASRHAGMLGSGFARPKGGRGGEKILASRGLNLPHGKPHYSDSATLKGRSDGLRSPIYMEWSGPRRAV